MIGLRVAWFWGGVGESWVWEGDEKSDAIIG